MKLPIALQLYTVRDAMAADPLGTLRRVKEMGYDGVELAGLCGLSAAEMKAALDEVGLTCVSAHVPVADMQAVGTLAAYREIGCRFVAVPWMDYGTDGERLAENLATVADLADRAAAEGLMLLYHNHDFEFFRVDGRTMLDTLYDTVGPDRLMTELDTCWVKFAGADPVEYLARYAGRAPIVHLKDFYADTVGGAAPYELIGKGQEAREQSSFVFRPLGEGLQDVPALVRAAEEAGAEWLVVEQDQSPDRPALEAAERSLRYLRSL